MLSFVARRLLGMAAVLAFVAVGVFVIARVMPGTVRRHEVPGLRALKYVVTDALPGGVYATLHAGLHWQKAAIWVLLDLELDGP